MKGKDRDRMSPPGGAMAAMAAATALLLCPAGARAASIRLWPTAVVVSDSIRVDEVCELTGFTPDAYEQLSRLIVAGAPVAGGSRFISLDLVRSTVAQSGTNMAHVTFAGATSCAVSRPSVVDSPPSPRGTDRSGSRRSDPGQDPAQSAADSGDAPRTLRRAVVDFCNARLSRYGGTAQVTFDRTSERLLELSEPQYRFRVRTRGGGPLGMVPLEVDVLAGDRLVQTVPLVVQVVMTRHVLVARRTVNQGATITATDLDLIELSFNRVDDVGMEDASYVVGQQAKRVIPAGTPIQPELLEPVPVVRRGQLVTLTSAAGAIWVVTTAKAGADGLVGDTIKVRSVEDRRVEFDAVVIGPGRVRLGAVPPAPDRVALGGGS